MPDFKIECQLTIIGDLDRREIVTLYAGPFTLPFVPSKGMVLHLQSNTAIEGYFSVKCRRVEWWHNDAVFCVNDEWDVRKTDTDYYQAVEISELSGWRRERDAPGDMATDPSPPGRAVVRES